MVWTAVYGMLIRWTESDNAGLFVMVSYIYSMCTLFSSQILIWMFLYMQICCCCFSVVINSIGVLTSTISKLGFMLSPFLFSVQI